MWLSPHQACLSRGGIWILVTFVAGCSSYSGPSEYEQQKQAKESFQREVTEQGGKAEQKTFSMYGRSGSAWVIDLSGATISDELIESMTTLEYIAEIDLSKSTITDDQLIRFDEKKLGRVVLKLDLSGTGITDAALDKLENFYCLQTVNLKGTKVTPQGVERFKKSQQSNPNVQLPFKNPQVEL